MTLKQFKLHAVRAYIQLGLFFYYKKIEVQGREHVPSSGAVLMLCNHQNALLDPLLIATHTNRFCYYLTRAAVFKKPFVSKLLKGLNMLPVYRVRDGWQTITNNNAIFESCKSLLEAEEALVIFPEGSHNLKRHVRPLSKGFTRIVLDTLEVHPNLDLQLLPMGVNYMNAQNYGDSVLLKIGEPLQAKPYTTLEKVEAVKALKQDIQKELQGLTTHINQEYEDTLHKLDNQNANYLNPNAVNHYIETGEKQAGFMSKSNSFKAVGDFFKLLLKIILLPVYALWKLVIVPKISEKEFVGTFRFAIGLTLVPLWLLIKISGIGLFLGWWIALLILLSFILIAVLAVKL